ncbi:transposase, partial [Microbulbifer thermotolerans]|nr:transposase [Microbulbifer thermotolerans]
EAWTLREVVDRWHQLCKGSPFSQRFTRNEALNAAELARLEEVAAEWRERLMDISWFMRMLNESIARQANREDGCTGRFWES